MKSASRSISAMTPKRAGMAKAAGGEQQPNSFHQTSDAVVRTEPGEESAAGASQAQPVPEAIESLVSALAESRGWMRDYSKAIIEAAIEREPLAPMAETPMQGPVAWMNRETGKVTVCEPGHIYVFDVWVKSEIPLYTHPASEVEAARASLPAPNATEWTLLTDDEIDEIYERERPYTAFCYMARDLERAFIAKNVLRARHSADTDRLVSNEKESATAPTSQETAEMQDSFHSAQLSGKVDTAAMEMRAEFFAWVRDQGCDTDGAWSAWQGCWNRRAAPPSDAAMTALKELVDVKTLKEATEALHFAGPLSSFGNEWDVEYERLRAEYIRRQPAAWDRARSLVAAQEIQPVQRDDSALLKEAMETLTLVAGNLQICWHSSTWERDPTAIQIRATLAKLRERLGDV